MQSKFIDLLLESFLFLRGEYFAFFLIFLKARGVREARWGSKGGALLLPVWPGFESWRRCHMLVGVVADSLLCSERFLSEYSGFSISLKASTSKFQFDLETHGRIPASSQELISVLWVNKYNKLQIYSAPEFGYRVILRQSANDDLSADKIFK